jgi:hypothetical protein
VSDKGQCCSSFSLIAVLQARIKETSADGLRVEVIRGDIGRRHLTNNVFYGPTPSSLLTLSNIKDNMDTNNTVSRNLRPPSEL